MGCLYSSFNEEEMVIRESVININRSNKKMNFIRNSLMIENKGAEGSFNYQKSIELDNDDYKFEIDKYQSVFGGDSVHNDYNNNTKKKTNFYSGEEPISNEDENDLVNYRTFL